MSSKLKLTGLGGGDTILQGNDSITTDQAFTLPDVGGTLDRLERAGNILQVVSSETSTSVSNTLASMEDTGLSASITPSSVNNKILVMIDQAYLAQRSGSASGVGVNVLRNSTTIHSAQSTAGPATFYIAEASQVYGRVQMTILDSPASTSAITYKTQGRATFTTSSGFVEFQPNIVVGGVSRLILMEVAG